MQIVPVINCSDKECVEGALVQLREFLPPEHWVHFDIADGRFTYHKTWLTPDEFKRLGLPYRAEVHLMIEEPERALEEWLTAKVKRVIVHWEAIADPAFRADAAAVEAVVQKILGLCRAYGAEIFLALNPETAIEPLKIMVEEFDGALILAVHPGLSGQKFQPRVLEKIKFLRRSIPGVTIEIDGGVTPETARCAREAGADTLASGAYILSGGADAKTAYEELKKV